MLYLLIFPLCFLAATKVTIQSKFSKSHIKTPIDAIFFNMLIFTASAILSIPSLIDGITSENVLWGAAFGVCNILFQLFYCFALRYGSVSITVLIVNCSMIVPTALSVFLFGEPILPQRVIGMLLILVTFFLNADHSHKQHISHRWSFFIIAAFLANCGCNIVQKCYPAFCKNPENTDFVAAAYLCAAVLSALCCLFFYHKKENCSFRVSVKVCMTALSIGLILWIFQILNTYAVSVLDGTILFPSYNGGTTLLIACIGLTLFREKLSKKQMLGFGAGIAGIVCMCI